MKIAVELHMWVRGELAVWRHTRCCFLNKPRKAPTKEIAPPCGYLCRLASIIVITHFLTLCVSVATSVEMNSNIYRFPVTAG